MTKRLLDFKENPVQTLTLQELSETVDERTVGGIPIGGITHFVLLQRIADMLTENKLTVEQIKELSSVLREINIKIYKCYGDFYDL